MMRHRNHNQERNSNCMMQGCGHGAKRGSGLGGHGKSKNGHGRGRSRGMRFMRHGAAFQGDHDIYFMEPEAAADKAEFRSGNEVSSPVIEVCPLCDKHCPIDSLSCDKGVAFMNGKRP